MTKKLLSFLTFAALLTGMVVTPQAQAQSGSRIMLLVNNYTVPADANGYPNYAGATLAQASGSGQAPYREYVCGSATTMAGISLADVNAHCNNIAAATGGRLAYVVKSAYSYTFPQNMKVLNSVNIQTYPGIRGVYDGQIFSKIWYTYSNGNGGFVDFIALGSGVAAYNGWTVTPVGTNQNNRIGILVNSRTCTDPTKIDAATCQSTGLSNGGKYVDYVCGSSSNLNGVDLTDVNTNCSGILAAAGNGTAFVYKEKSTVNFPEGGKASLSERWRFMTNQAGTYNGFNANITYHINWTNGAWSQWQKLGPATPTFTTTTF